jgi:hypothetical protein
MNIQEFISIIEEEFDEVENGALEASTSFRQICRCLPLHHELCIFCWS